eukprot:TRINITY_DN1177_c0_g2_i3.p1 TRINITY_DN1177_c0_g2~~TRINITY_DN1177_c0_g2_i3.p1  ORF type:complete len:656 (-),score=156.88 TRINITY_DN1177_c0_g2_i3:146-2113(-)
MIVTKTGKFIKSETDMDIFIRIKGTLGSTEIIKLDNIFKNDFERDKKDHFIVHGEKIGDFLAIELSTGNGSDSYWYCENIAITEHATNKSCIFPIFSWVGKQDNRSFVVGTSLPQKRDSVTSSLLTMELQHTKKMFNWTNDRVQLPGFCDIPEHRELPVNVRFDLGREKDFWNGVTEASVEVGVNAFLTMLKEFWKTPEDFVTMLPFEHFRPKRIIENWKSDVEFGWQMMNGVNPYIICGIDKLPSNFPVTEEIIINSLRKGKSLETELADGRFFLLDYAFVEDLPLKEGRHCGAPLCLLYLNEANVLVPVAIQLTQKPGPQSPIFTPSDSESDWLLAKLFVQCADGQIHQTTSHLLKGHLAVEPFAIAMYRNLPINHPVYKLIHPHLKYVIAINTIGRKTLISPGGIADKTLCVDVVKALQKGFRAWTVADMYLKYDLKKRRVDDPAKLPNYFYRDDSLLIWKTVEKFVRNMLGLFYENDTDVVEDNEVQNWASDIYKNGLPEDKFYTDIRTVSQLVQLVTAVIFTASVTHASANTPQFYYYAFIPNKPIALHKPPPTSKGTTTMDDLMDYLPSKSVAAQQIATVWYLSRYSKNEVYFGQYDEYWWTEPDARLHMAEFQDAISHVEEMINSRNLHLEEPYTYLLPSSMPNGVSL